MATTPIAAKLPEGLTSMTLELYPIGSDTIANGAGGDSLAEETNRKGLYLASVAESITGDHYALIKLSSGDKLADGYVIDLEDTTTQQYVTDFAPRLTADIASAARTEMADDFGMVRDAVESQRDEHSQIGKGERYYVDVINGDTHANGARGGRSDPYSTMQDCIDNAVVTGRGDTIYLVASGGAGGTDHDEQWTCPKDYVFIRPPGSGYRFITSSSGDTITLTGDGIELSSCEVRTHTAGSGSGIVCSGEHPQLRHIIVSQTQGDGITVTNASRALLENCRLYNTGQGGSGDGIVIDGSGSTTRDTKIVDCSVFDTKGTGIVLKGNGVNDTSIKHCTVEGSTGWGISVGSGVSSSIITDNTLANNSSGAIEDNGDNTVDDRNDDWPDVVSIRTEMDDNSSDLDAIKAKTDTITSKKVVFTSPVAVDGTTVTIRQGDSYQNSDGEAIEWTGDVADQWPDLTNATLKLTARYGKQKFTQTVTAPTPTGTQVLRMELTPAETITFAPGSEYEYDIQASWNSGNQVTTLVEGSLTVKRTLTDPPS